MVIDSAIKNARVRLKYAYYYFQFRHSAESAVFQYLRGQLIFRHKHSCKIPQQVIRCRSSAEKLCSSGRGGGVLIIDWT